MPSPQSSKLLSSNHPVDGLAIFVVKEASTRGFSLPLALGFGLILLILAQTMILRAYQQRIATLGQVASNDALAVAEIGVTRYQAFLNRYRDLAPYSACVPTSAEQSCPENTWQQAPKLLAGKVCPNSAPSLQSQVLQSIASQDTGAWQMVDRNDSSQREYRLVSYQVQGNEGKLTIEGRISQKVVATNPEQITQARLQVVIPITPSRMERLAIYPGLWLATLDTQPPVSLSAATTSAEPPAPRLSLQGNVFINDCGVDLNAISPNPPLTVASNAVLQTNIPLPTLPALPAVNQPTSGSTPPNPQLPIVYSLGKVTKSLTLPRSGDLSSPSGTSQVFRYLIDSINLPRTGRLRIDASKQRDALLSSVEVELYVRGPISSTGKLEHVCTSANGCQPIDLEIFAYQNADRANSDGSYPEFCLGEGQTFAGFLFAPGYQVGLSNNAKFTGTLWARAWNFKCATNPETTTFTQSGNWGSRQVMLPPQLSAIQQWRRVSQETR